MTALIELTKITKQFGTFRALDGVSLEIGSGITGLLGPNGAGKSTLIKILLGLLRTTTGHGRLLGYELGRQKYQILSKVGYMPEDDCYLHGLSGIESVHLSAQLSRFPKTEGLRRAHEIMDYCGIAQERYRTVETYSTGMRQKLRFAQAIVHDPPVLILDEPTSGLDPEERVAMLNRIRRLAKDEGKTVLICTHILPDVQAISDAVVILAEGKVCVADSLANLNRPTSPSVQVRVLGSADEFAQALKGLGLTVELLETSRLVVRGAAESLSDQIWRAAYQAGVGIRSLSPSRNSLEEVFLNAVQGNLQEPAQ